MRTCYLWRKNGKGECGLEVGRGDESKQGGRIRLMHSPVPINSCMRRDLKQDSGGGDFIFFYMGSSLR